MKVNLCQLAFYGVAALQEQLCSQELDLAGRLFTRLRISLPIRLLHWQVLTQPSHPLYRMSESYKKQAACWRMDRVAKLVTN